MSDAGVAQVTPRSAEKSQRGDLKRVVAGGEGGISAAALLLRINSPAARFLIPSIETYPAQMLLSRACNAAIGRMIQLAEWADLH